MTRGRACVRVTCGHGAKGVRRGRAAPRGLPPTPLPPHCPLPSRPRPEVSPLPLHPNALLKTRPYLTAERNLPDWAKAGVGSGQHAPATQGQGAHPRPELRRGPLVLAIAGEAVELPDHPPLPGSNVVLGAARAGAPAVTGPPHPHGIRHQRSSSRAATTPDPQRQRKGATRTADTSRTHNSPCSGAVDLPLLLPRTQNVANVAAPPWRPPRFHSGGLHTQPNLSAATTPWSNR